MCTWAVVAVAVKSKIRSDLVLCTSTMVFAAENALFALQSGLRSWCAVLGCWRCGCDERLLFGVPAAKTIQLLRRTPRARASCSCGVAISQAVVMAHDGPVLG